MTYSLEVSLRNTVDDVDRQIRALQDESDARGVPASMLRDSNGAYLLTPLLLAKSQALHGLALLKTKTP